MVWTHGGLAALDSPSLSHSEAEGGPDLLDDASGRLKNLVLGDINAYNHVDRCVGVCS